MKFGSACSGTEGASVAWEPLGFEAQWFAEIDPFCSELLKIKYPKVKNYGDFTTIGTDAKHIDLLVGGTPCQSFSVAGLRKGLDDDRGNLALEYIRLAQRTRAKWLLWENVPGVLSSKKGTDFACFLSGLSGVDITAPPKGWKNSGLVIGREGHYSLCWRVLDAQYFGVPQRRRRVFVVGHLGDWRRAAAVLLERDSLRGHPATSRTKGKEIAGTVKGGSGERGYPDPSDGNGGGLVAQGYRATGYGQYSEGCRTLRNSGGDLGGGSETIVCTLGHSKSNGLGVSEATVANTLEGTGSSNQAIAFNWQDNQNFKASGMSNPLRVGQTEAVVIPINTQLGLRGAETSNTPREGVGIGKPFDPAFTLQSSHCHAFNVGMVVRRFTPRECERLQGLPDDYTLIPFNKKSAPDSRRYKAVGNGFAIPVVQEIGRRIKAVNQVINEGL